MAFLFAFSAFFTCVVAFLLALWLFYLRSVFFLFVLWLFICVVVFLFALWYLYLRCGFFCCFAPVGHRNSPNLSCEKHIISTFVDPKPICSLLANAVFFKTSFLDSVTNGIDPTSVASATC